MSIILDQIGMQPGEVGVAASWRTATGTHLRLVPVFDDDDNAGVRVYAKTGEGGWTFFDCHPHRGLPPRRRPR
ncbi:hypothetical protein ACQP1V_06305 [Microtetraspora malaysiensis]|uniref:hypothetical protein n=1 Tax=Microtetraspora malaysiensis TaxID=161358 RepID=UPI003D901618